MKDFILEAIFLNSSLWKDVIEHGIDKHINHHLLTQIADPHFRADLCISIGSGEYIIQPPRTGYRKKDDGSERIFLVNNQQDRILLNVIYKWLMQYEKEMIHSSCKSYQSGIGIGKIAREVSARLVGDVSAKRGRILGRKLDIHKYFESIGREYIHDIFTKVEKDYGNSSVIDLLRAYYDSDIYYDTRKQKEEIGYYGIKQGSAVSAWLANVLLYSLDEELSRRSGLYVRYSDDILYLGDDYEEVTEIIKSHLSNIGLQLNEKKQTDIIRGEYFSFLGYDICGSEITLSRKWVKKFQKEIDKRTIGNRKLIATVRSIRQSNGNNKESQLDEILKKAMKKVSHYILYGNGRFSWAKEVLPVVNNADDIHQLSMYCLDAVRAVYTGKTNIGGLGKSLKNGIQRGMGRNVKSNRVATRHLEVQDGDGCRLNGFLTLSAVQHALSNKWLYRTLAVSLIDRKRYPLYRQTKTDISHEKSREIIIDELETRYEKYMNSIPDGENINRFYSYSIDDMTIDMLIKGGNRNEAFRELEQYLLDNVTFKILQNDDQQWYWQSQSYPQLVLLRDWF